MALFSFLSTKESVSFDKDNIKNEILTRINREYSESFILNNIENVDFVIIINIIPTIHTKRGVLNPVEGQIKTNLQMIFAIKILERGRKFPSTPEEEEFANNLKKWCKRLIITDNAPSVIYTIGECLDEIGLA